MLNLSVCRLFITQIQVILQGNLKSIFILLRLVTRGFYFLYDMNDGVLMMIYFELFTVLFDVTTQDLNLLYHKVLKLSLEIENTVNAKLFLFKLSTSNLINKFFTRKISMLIIVVNEVRHWTSFRTGRQSTIYQVNQLILF